MEVVIFAVVLFVILGIFGGIPGLIASSRGHNFWLFAILGIFISPLLAIILALVISPPAGSGRGRRRSRRQGREGRGDTRRVPQRARRARA